MWGEATIPVWLALIGLATAILTGTVSPILVGWFAAKRDRRNKKEDYDRQDVVAAKAAEAAILLLAANERVAKTAAVTNQKLDVIHTLVNSNMTAAMQAELDAINKERADALAFKALTQPI